MAQCLDRRSDRPMARDSYEVYYYQNGRWSLHASYEGDQRDEAVAEAMSVEAKLGYPARLVKETFYPETNTSDESIAWQGAKAKMVGDADNMFGQKKNAAPKSEAKKAPPPRPAPARETPKRPARPAVQAARKPGKPKKKTKDRSTLGKVVFSFLVSGAIAVVTATIAAFFVAYYQSMELVSPEDRLPLISGAFVMMFFVSLIVMLNNQFELLKVILRRDAKTPAKRPPAAQSQQPKTKVKRAPSAQEDEFDQIEIERGQEEIDEITEADEEETADEEVQEEDELPPDLDAEMGDSESHIAEPEPTQDQPQPVEMQSPPEPAKPQPKAELKEQPAPKPDPKPQNQNESEARQIFASFVTQAQGNVRQDIGDLNPVSRFGMSLLLAGAVSSLGQSKKLTRDPQIGILKQGLKAIGNTSDRTETFCAELPGYGKNPRYTGMIQNGSKAMTSYLGGSQTATQGMGTMLQEWSKPEKRPSVPSVFTFLFTDIAGSTAMTQQLGNAGAQKAVRAHNTAVRNAIAGVGGREVKHTGDGIMAVFGDSPSAVMASIQMQRDIYAHNAANPSLPLVVRIGINAGEAVEEENDFFGAAVQMTARICSKARDGHIWASQSVVDACKGQRLGFIPRGKYEMKGIQGARPLYEVGWTEEHKNELADL